jgi:hypothetical protein
MVKFKAIIRKDGKVVVEVLERSQGSQCSSINHLTQRLGKVLSDEHTGPDGDEVHEVHS